MSHDLLPWIVLGVVVLGMLPPALSVFDLDAHEVKLREDAAWEWSGSRQAWASGAVVFATRGSQAGGEYLAGYPI